jgi:acylglycerol lipase
VEAALSRFSSIALTCFFALGLFGCGSYAPNLPAHSAPQLDPIAGIDRGQDLFKGSGDITLFEQWWRPNNRPVRGAVAIVHGLRDHSGRYVELATRLAQEGTAVYAMDLRGHAHSSGTRVDVADFDDYCKDLDIFLARVRSREAGKPLFLFAHSMGGAIATLDVITRKPDLAGLIMTGPALEADVSGVKIFGTKVVAAISPDAGIFSLDVDQMSRDKQVVEAGKKDPLVYQDGAPARTARELLNAMDVIHAHENEITIPLFVMHGGADTVTSPQGSKDLIAKAASKDKAIKIYPGYYHDLLHEPSPDKEVVLGDIAAFVDRHEPR